MNLTSLMLHQISLIFSKIIQIKQTAQTPSLQGLQRACHYCQVHQEACKGKVSYSLSPHSLSPPSSSPSPHHSLPNKSNNDLTDHSFYQSEDNSKPTQERHTKKGKAAKEPTSSSGNKKEDSKQASKTLSLPPPNGSSPLTSDFQEESEDYFNNFKASGHMTWDPLCFPCYFLIISVKGSSVYIADNYIFHCNNQKGATKSKHFVCEDKS
ncbi:hypothetical protein DSO57_1036358 [Entomophthora muscae]|uniref:Uncharacterized protein n=1 Tax=Entomophthora muscae TaxID=34485 RepID=A0ACC2UK30_9FUNG|nr:hypothetical protein DSO57_1036358 [Entomophthora muscae]